MAKQMVKSYFLTHFLFMVIGFSTARQETTCKDGGGLAGGIQTIDLSNDSVRK